MSNNFERDQYYAGTFNVLGEEISGQLIYNKSKGIILLNLIKSLSDISAFGKRYGNVDVITGELNSGTTVTLFHNHCTKNHTQGFRMQQLNYVADYMIWSRCEVINKKYNKMTCILQNALQWSGLSCLDITNDFNIKFKNSRDDNVYNWFGAKIVFSTDLESGLFSFPRDEEIKVIERLVVEIEADEKQDTTYFTAIRDKIIAFISFAIRDNVNIYKQYLIDYEDSYTVSESIIDYYKQSLFTSECYLPIQNQSFMNYNFMLKQIPSGKDITEELLQLAPIFNLYLSLFKYRDMPKEMIFLNIVQALETFHARFFYDNKKEKYVESVINRFGKHQNFADIEKLLLCDTQKDENCNYIILVSRLNDLLIGREDGLFNKYYVANPKYAQIIADTRHYYTHYSKAKEKKALKGDDLLRAIFVLSLLLEHNICLKLGIDKKDTIRERLGAIDE